METTFRVPVSVLDSNGYLEVTTDKGGTGVGSVRLCAQYEKPAYHNQPAAQDTVCVDAGAVVQKVVSDEVLLSFKP
jgi:hypothetical protein